MFSNSSLFKSYERRKFFVIFGIKIFLMICIPVFLFASIFLHYNYYNTKDKMDTESQKNIYSVRSEIEGMLSSFDLIHTSLSGSSSIHSYLMNTISTRDIHSFMTEFGKDVQKFRASNTLISSIYLYRVSDEYIIASGDNSPGNDYIKSFGDKCGFSKNVSDIDYIAVRTTTIGRQNLQFLSCMYPVYNNDLLLGIICINVNTINFKENLDLILPENSNIDIIYKSKLILSTGTKSCTSKKSEINPLTGQVNVKDTLGLSGIDVCLCYKSNLLLIKYLYNPISLLMLILIIALISWGISHLFTSSFYNMLASIIIKSTDPLDMYEKDSQYTEQYNSLIAKIASHFHKNKNTEKELYERLSSFGNLQFNYLQLQISPHFLYNTLNAISMLEIKLYKKSQIGKTVNQLSDVLRYSLNIGEHTTMFIEELNYASKYLDIQKLRYGDLLEVIYHTDSKTNNIKVLKFILQPIIENAIHHGMTHSEKCVVEIRTILEDDKFLIEIINNGDGIDNDKLDELNHMLDKGLLRTSRTSGLLNVNKRLKIVYGEHYGCNIKIHNRKTIVTITMPNN